MNSVPFSDVFDVSTLQGGIVNGTGRKKRRPLMSDIRSASRWAVNVRFWP